KTRLAPLPLTASLFAPSPSMSRFVVIANCPLVRVIVCPLRLLAKLIVSPLLATAMAARSEPGPLSRLFRTVRVLGSQRSSRASSRGRNVARLPGEDLCVGLG